MIPLGGKDIAVLCVAASLFIGGWVTRGWYEDSKDLATAEAVEKSREVMRELAGEISVNTELALQGIKIENKTIYNETQKEVVRETIYADCVLPESGRVRVNQARSGAASGKPDNPVPAARTAP